jgi:molecular chaperone Hsp33
MDNSKDFRQRFVFDNLDVRGCVVSLQQTLDSIQATHHYPKNLGLVLNQFALAATLLRDSIKIDGSLTIQLRTPGAIKLIMADCLSDRSVRAIAEYDQYNFAASDQLALDQLGEGSILSITITPDDGERYQSIVPIENSSLADCLADYFARSEQLPSSFKLFADTESGVGVALHALPSQKIVDKGQSQENFARLTMLLDTLSKTEALELGSEELLTRLFHDESCRLFDPSDVGFGCVCSASKSLDAIKSLGQHDVEALITEHRSDGKSGLVVDCHFCFQRYEFKFTELDALFS